MNTYICKSLLCFSFLGMLLTGCHFQPKEARENDIQFDSIQVDKTYHLLENPDNPNCNLQLSFTFPSHFSNKEILKKVQDHFVLSYFGESYKDLTPEEAVARYSDDYLATYKELETEFKKELERKDDLPVGAWFSYYEMSSDEITYNRNGLVSYTVYFENYTGGAHGAHAYNHFVLDATTGERIHEEDIYGEGYQDLLAEILVHAITRDNDLSDPKELENIGFFSVDEIYPNNNFYVDDSGITYTFNEYEVAAYVVGPVHVHLSFDEVHVLLKPDTPIAKLAGKL